MMQRILGKGPSAIRVRLDDDGAELRAPNVLIHGNGDLASALQWVIEHPDAEGDPSSLGPDVTVEALVDVLRQLRQAGVPSSAWGTAWLAKAAAITATAQDAG